MSEDGKLENICDSGPDNYQVDASTLLVSVQPPAEAHQHQQFGFGFQTMNIFKIQHPSSTRNI